MRLPWEPQSCLAEASYEVVAGFTMGSELGGLVTSCSVEYKSSLVPEWMGQTPAPFLVGDSGTWFNFRVHS